MTSSLHSNEGRAHYAVDTLEVGLRGKIGPFATWNGNAVSVRAFPYCPMPSKQYLAAAHPAGGHVTRLEHHRRGRPVLLGAVVDQEAQTYLSKLLGVLSTVSLLWRLHVASRQQRAAA